MRIYMSVCYVLENKRMKRVNVGEWVCGEVVESKRVYVNVSMRSDTCYMYAGQRTDFRSWFFPTVGSGNRICSWGSLYRQVLSYAEAISLASIGHFLLLSKMYFYFLWVGVYIMLYVCRYLQRPEEVAGFLRSLSCRQLWAPCGCWEQNLGARKE